jgi:hypothetical protein
LISRLSNANRPLDDLAVASLGTSTSSAIPRATAIRNLAPDEGFVLRFSGADCDVGFPFRQIEKPLGHR